MNQVQIFRILTANGFKKEDADGLIEALKNDEIATKQDLQMMKMELKKDINEMGHSVRGEIKDMEIRLLSSINSQTWKFIGSLAALGVVFKIAEMVIK